MNAAYRTSFVVCFTSYSPFCPVASVVAGLHGSVTKKLTAIDFASVTKASSSVVSGIETITDGENPLAGRMHFV